MSQYRKPVSRRGHSDLGAVCPITPSTEEEILNTFNTPISAKYLITERECTYPIFLVKTQLIYSFIIKPQVVNHYFCSMTSNILELVGEKKGNKRITKRTTLNKHAEPASLEGTNLLQKFILC